MLKVICNKNSIKTTTDLYLLKYKKNSNSADKGVVMGFRFLQVSLKNQLGNMYLKILKFSVPLTQLSTLMESSLKKPSLMNADLKILSHIKMRVFLWEEKAFHNFITNIHHNIDNLFCVSRRVTRQ